MKCNLLFALGIGLCSFLTQSVYGLMERSKTSALMRVPQILLVLYRETLHGEPTLLCCHREAVTMEGV